MIYYVHNTFIFIWKRTIRITINVIYRFYDPCIYFLQRWKSSSCADTALIYFQIHFPRCFIFEWIDFFHFILFFSLNKIRKKKKDAENKWIYQKKRGGYRIHMDLNPSSTCSCSIVQVKLTSSEDPSFWEEKEQDTVHWKIITQKGTRKRHKDVFRVSPQCPVRSGRQARWPCRPGSSVGKTNIFFEEVAQQKTQKLRSKTLSPVPSCGIVDATTRR